MTNKHVGRRSTSCVIREAGIKTERRGHCALTGMSTTKMPDGARRRGRGEVGALGAAGGNA